MFITLMGIFLLGIFLIALEDKIHVNKAAVALMMSVVLWLVVAMRMEVDVVSSFVGKLGDVSETLFFVMGSMVIVELIDTHGGFRIITNAINTSNKRKLLVILSFLTFFLSALLDNLATGIIMVALLRKIIPHRTERWIYASMVIIAANAGGSWSPIGDVTTILLWTGGTLTPLHQVSHLFLPALVSMLVPLFFVTRFFTKEAAWSKQLTIRNENSKLLPQISSKSRTTILVVGVGTLAFVPVFNEISGLPPFMCIILGVSVLWVYTDLMYRRMRHSVTDVKLPIAQLLSHVDMSTILFFMGILMSVAALDVSGQLKLVSDFLSGNIESPLTIAAVIGVVSSFVDNVALVAATMGMYDVVPGSLDFMVNGEFWTFLAYCAVTGGSLLIIGSATGVTVMGLEKVPFMYYLKRFSLLALSGYVSGVAMFLLLRLL